MIWYDILLHVLAILMMGLICIYILVWCSHQIWIMHLLKNECIADCEEYNQEAKKLGMNERCVC